MKCPKCNEQVIPVRLQDVNGAGYWSMKCCDTEVCDYTLGGCLELAIATGFMGEKVCVKDSGVSDNAGP